MKTFTALLFLLSNLSLFSQAVFTSAEYGSNRQPVTVEVLNSSTIGSAGKWSVVGSLMVSTDYAAPTSEPSSVDGAIYLTKPTSTRSFSQTNLRNRQYLRYALNDLSSRVSLSFDIKLKGFKGASWGYYDFAALEGGGEYTVLAFKDFPGKEFAFRVHTQAGVGKDVTISSDKSYRVRLLWDQAERLATLRVYDGTNLVGVSTLVLQNNYCQALYVGRYDAHSASSSAITYFDNIKIDPTGKSFFEDAEVVAPAPVVSLPVITNIVSVQQGYKTNRTVSITTNYVVTTNLFYTTNVVLSVEPVYHFITNVYIGIQTTTTNEVLVTNNMPPPPSINSTPSGTRQPTTNEVTAKSASYSDVKEAYLQTKQDGTLIIPGSATWTTAFLVDKRITIRGLRQEETVITFNLPSQTSSGFVLTADGARLTSMQIRGPKSANKGRAVEIKADKCVLDNLFIDQMYWGVYTQHGFNLIYNVHFRDCQKFIRFHGRGAGTDNWNNYYPIAFDSLNHSVAEDCLFENTEEMPNVGTLNAISSQQGASWILRNSTFRLNKYSYGPVLDGHGNINPGLRGVVSIQVINNRFEVGRPAEFYKLFDWRGGSGIFASNTIVATSGEMVVLREEDHPNTPLTPPFTDPHTNIYIWANKIPTGVAALRVEANDLPIIREGKEYFLSAPIGFKSVPYPHPLRKNIK